jgi:hypothetical protein
MAISNSKSKRNLRKKRNFASRIDFKDIDDFENQTGTCFPYYNSPEMKEARSLIWFVVAFLLEANEATFETRKFENKNIDETMLSFLFSRRLW